MPSPLTSILNTMLALTLALAAPVFAADLDYELAHQGRQRSYTLHLPPAADASLQPLVMVLHGGGGNAANAARMTGMDGIADREGFLVVYPNGSGRFRRLLTWNAGNCCGRALDEGVDDVGFLNAVVDDVARRHKVDARRVYVTGMSNGGMMTYRLGCESARRFAAIAPVAGAMNVACKPDAPLSVIAFHGTADRHVRYEGGPPLANVDRHARADAPERQTMDFWRGANGCREQTAERRGSVTIDRMSGCAAGTEVELVTLEGFGHAWPGGERGSRRGDDPAAVVNASEMIWDFFRRHTR